MMSRTNPQPHRPGKKPLLRRALLALALPALSLGWAASAAPAQPMKPAGDGTTIQDPTKVDPKGFEDVGIDQKLNAQVPGDLTFRDHTGKVVKLSDYYAKGRPILFTLVYYGCPRLCTTVLNEMNKSLKPMSLNPGSDYEILVVSFDPREGPDLSYPKREEYTQSFRRPGTEHGWHFLTGDEANIKALTEAVGFRYAWDEKHNQYIHAGGVMVMTPDGRLSKYFYGVDYKFTDLKLALMEAGGGKVGSLSDQVLLYCFQYDPHTGRYSLAILNIVKAAGVLTVLCLGTFVVWNLRRRPAVPLRPVDGVDGDGDGAGDGAGPERRQQRNEPSNSQDVKDNG